MRISIVALSDSHAASTNELPRGLREALPKADVIVHAGDHTEFSLLQELQALGPHVIAVTGNMDSTAIRLQLPHRQLTTVNGTNLGVAHGSGPPEGIAVRVRALFPEDPDIIIFGHSHVPFNGLVDGTLMVNPGQSSKSYARIIVGDTLSAEIVTLP